MSPDGLMLFDGVCHLCDGAVRTVLRLDRAGVIRFTPILSPYGRKLALTHGLDPNAPESFLFFDRGRPLTKTAAVAAVVVPPTSPATAARKETPQPPREPPRERSMWELWYR